MNRRTFLVVGILLVILGIVLFVERGFFASTFLSASVLGNMGWDYDDANKIQTVAIVGGLAFLSGVVVTLIGVFKKDKQSG